MFVFIVWQNYLMYAPVDRQDDFSFHFRSPKGRSCVKQTPNIEVVMSASRDRFLKLLYDAVSA